VETRAPTARAGRLARECCASGFVVAKALAALVTFDQFWRSIPMTVSQE
jgi:hypothetical protein